VSGRPFWELSPGPEFLDIPLELFQPGAFTDGALTIGATIRAAILDQPVAQSLGTDPLFPRHVANRL